MSESNLDVDTQPGDELLAELADDFLRRYRAGEHPSVDEYAKKHPALADRIPDLFAAVIAMEQPGGSPTLEFHAGAERVGEVIGRYKLLERIGEGGFGVVYMAEQQHPVRRKVALKVIKPGMDTRQVVARFEAERQALAIMDHPNIAKVHDGGATTSGRPFFVMELVKGAPITEFCDANHLTPRQRLELFVPVCQAVQHAHHKGIIHRDLKPSNVLVTMHDTTPIVKVIDFGVAKALGQELTDKTLFTGFAEMIGTPLYMSPEQAGQSGLDIDTRSDIYSLGVLLYELLTGTTPFTKERFKQAAGDEIRRIIREEDPPKPSTRLSDLSSAKQVTPLPTTSSLASISARRHIEPAKLMKLMRGELDWIVMKALEKERARRYETANGLALDIQRHLADEPVVACPPSIRYRFRKFVRRYKVAMLTTAFIATAIIFGIIVSTWQMIRAFQAEAQNEIRRVELLGNLLIRASREYTDGRNLEGIALLSRACEEAGPDTSLNDSVRRLMSGWSAQAAQPLIHDAVVLTAAFSPEGRTILTGGHDPRNTAQLWDAQTTLPLGKALEHADSVRAVAFSPNGRIALTGSQGNTAQLWDCETGTPIGKPLRHSNKVWAVAFSPDGSNVITGGWDRTVRLWDARTGESLGEPLVHSDKVLALAFSPDGKTMLSGTYGGTAQIWDAKSRLPLGTPLQLGKPIYSVTFSSDSRKILTGSADNTARMWDTRTHEPLGQPFQHESAVYAAAFSPDDKLVLTGSFDNTARLWSVETGESLGEPLRHEGWVMSVAFRSDGRMALTASADRTARIWKVIEGRVLQTAGAVNAAVISPHGAVVATSGPDKTARLWNAHTGSPLGETLAHDGTVLAVAFSVDGHILITGSADGHVRMWDVETRKSLGEALNLDGVVKEFHFCGDGANVLVQFTDQALQLWNIRTRKPLSRTLYFKDKSSLLAFSPDGRMALMRHGDGSAPLSSEDSSVRLWDLQAGIPRGEPLRHNAPITDAAFNHAGLTLLTAAFDQEVRRWDGMTGKAIGNAFRQRGVVNIMSRDGRMVLSGGSDTARLWDITSGMDLGPPLQHPSQVSKVALSHDGCLALTVCSDGSAHLWDTHVCERMARPLQYEALVTNGIFSSDGSIILFKCNDGTVRLYDVPLQLPDNPKTVRAWSRARTGFTLDDHGVLRQLAQSEWLASQAELNSLSKSPMP